MGVSSPPSQQKPAMLLCFHFPLPPFSHQKIMGMLNNFDIPKLWCKLSPVKPISLINEIVYPKKIATRRNKEGRYAVFKVKKDSSCLLLTGGMGCGAESLEIYFKKFDIFKVFFLVEKFTFSRGYLDVWRRRKSWL